MPELPEVETIRRELNKELVGLEVRDVVWEDKRLLKPDPQEVKQVIVGKQFTGVGRRAKLLVFVLSSNSRHSEAVRNTAEESHVGQDLQGILRSAQNDGGNAQNDGGGTAQDDVFQDGDYTFLLCHLRMSGRLLIRNQNDPEDKYVEVWIKLSKGKELRFANARKFGYIKLAGEDEVKQALKKYGPEPLDDLTLDKFKKILSNTRAMVKTVLIDQKRIAGIGNIYANDALWLAKIHPETPAKSLSENQMENLYQAVEKVLKEGLETKGASDMWYRDAHGGKGSYQQNFKVYGRKDKPCLRDDGGIIKRIKVGGRGTFYCPVCQDN